MATIPANILVIDDDPDHRSTLCALLREMGHDTTEAGSANEGLYLLRAQAAFDLVLSDVVMPGINGIDFAKRASSTRSNVKIVLVTGDSRVVDEVIASGALALLKPYSFETLHVIISDAIRSHSLARDIVVDEHPVK